MKLIFLFLLIFRIHASSESTPKILIYNDVGVSSFSVDCIKKRLASAGILPHQIAEISARDIIRNAAIPAKLFIFPGGIASKYRESLGSVGRAIIRNSCKSGLNIVGICAGAYFSCFKSSYRLKSDHKLYSTENLGLFEGVAKGPYLYPNDLGVDGAKIIAIKKQKDGREFLSVIHNGCYFKGSDISEKEILYHVDDDLKPSTMAIQTTYGEGKVFLSGAHLEIHSSDMNILRPDLIPVLAPSDIDRMEFFTEKLNELLS
jgi:glutamine amidotransferase-like uncharacterized protein